MVNESHTESTSRLCLYNITHAAASWMKHSLDRQSKVFRKPGIVSETVLRLTHKNQTWHFQNTQMKRNIEILHRAKHISWMCCLSVYLNTKYDCAVNLPNHRRLSLCGAPQTDPRVFFEKPANHRDASCTAGNKSSSSFDVIFGCEAAQWEECQRKTGPAPPSSLKHQTSYK